MLNCLQRLILIPSFNVVPDHGWLPQLQNPRRNQYKPGLPLKLHFGALRVHAQSPLLSDKSLILLIVYISISAFISFVNGNLIQIFNLKLLLGLPALILLGNRLPLIVELFSSRQTYFNLYPNAFTVRI